MSTLTAVMFAMMVGQLAPSADLAPAVVPQPVSLEVLPGSFAIAPSVRIVVPAGDAEVQAIGEYLSSHLERVCGVVLAVRSTGRMMAGKGEILLSTADIDDQLGEEGYELIVRRNEVTLRGKARGLFHGVQTIRQLLTHSSDAQAERSSKASLPGVRVWDKPRFVWRGMLLDCCRHFMSVDFVKRYIDLLAYHKMNVLHWHLTEDQGWRIEIEKYPKLTEIGAWRGEGANRHGGFYSKKDVTDIVAYAQSRYVTIVPEIEMPGHAQAALASYPKLSCTAGSFDVSTRWGVHPDVYCAGNEEVFTFLEDVLSEVIDLFPSEYIHIGGDECPKIRWKNCQKCQTRIKAEGLQNEDQLQSYFIRRMEKFLNDKGRHLIGWDEILEGGLAPNATVQSWRGMSAAVEAARAGHRVIASPTSHCYLDYPHSMTSLETSYSFEPVPAQLSAEQAALILGIEGNMWTEHAPQHRVDRQVFPRLCALAEVGWTPNTERDWKHFSRRMQRHYRRLEALGVDYFFPPPRCTTPDRVFTDSIDVVLEDPSGQGTLHYTVDGSTPGTQSPQVISALPLRDSTTVKAKTFLANGRSSDEATFTFEKQQPRAAVSRAGLTPGVHFEYFEGQWRRLPDFQQLTPLATGQTGTFDISVRRREDHFAVVFDGYIEVPAAGIYTFYIWSDDGSSLDIGPDVVVNHDGLHSASQRWGQIVLAAGCHPIRVAMFEAGGSQRLDVHYAGPGIPKQQIPAHVLFHSGVKPGGTKAHQR